MSAPIIELVHGDVCEVDPEMFDDFDVQLTDPPYSDHVHVAAVSVNSGDEMGVHRNHLGFASLSPQLQTRVATIASRVARWTVVFSDFEGGELWRESCLAANVEYVRTVPWVRWSQPQLSGDRPCTGAEATLWFHRQTVGAKGGVKPRAKRWNGPGSLVAFGSPGVVDHFPAFDAKAMRGKFKHPTEKPFDLALDLVCYASDPGENVVDPCAGRATIAQACRVLGRNCLCFELKEDFAVAAQSRLHAPLDDRDRDRLARWVERVSAEASSVPVPRAADGSDVKTYERAQRRLADVERAKEWL